MSYTAPIIEKTEVGAEEQVCRRLYRRLSEYVEINNKITYTDFEKYVLKEVCLFNIPDDTYMREVEQTLDIIIKALPAFKRVFARPIVRLKDHHEIMPIEAVRIIDKRSLSHIASRSEMWDDITSEGIKPRKLLTIEPVETYAIYENIAFAWAVDSILSFIRHTFVRIKNILYGCRDIHFNFLDHTHHNLYFLAIGKLYLEYARTRPSQDNFSRCVSKIMFIEKVLRSKLNSPVYRKCKRRNYNLKLKKTNIFRSHKDYEEIYKVLKHFESNLEEITNNISQVSSDDKEYVNFCKLLTLFSIGHFNYTFDENKEIDLSTLDIGCSFSSWNLHVKQINSSDTDALLFTTKKDREYTTCVLFCEKGCLTDEKKQNIMEQYFADEYITASPNMFGDPDSLYLNIYDIDSFRRIQQILLRGMILSDTERAQCPFCGEALRKEKGKYVCDACNGEIEDRICPDTRKSYTVSDLIQVKSNNVRKDSDEKRKYLHDKLWETQLHFRNITAITPEGHLICPHCKKIH